MAPFTDAKMNRLMTRYYGRDRDPRFLYDGGQETIVKELHAWVVRRQQVSREQMELRGKIVASTVGVGSPRTRAQHEAAVAEVARDLDRAEALDDEADEDTARAAYLLDTLRHRGVLWPKLWWRPEYDGGVCSFLGTVDPGFDPDHTLAALEDTQRERPEAGRAGLGARVDAETGHGVDKGKRPARGGESSAGGEGTTGEGSAREGEGTTTTTTTTTTTSFISALNTHPAKWETIMKAVDGGNYPRIRIEEAKLVAVASTQAESEMILKRFLADVFEDLDDE